VASVLCQMYNKIELLAIIFWWTLPTSFLRAPPTPVFTRRWIPAGQSRLPWGAPAQACAAPREGTSSSDQRSSPTGAVMRMSATSPGATNCRNGRISAGGVVTSQGTFRCGRSRAHVGGVPADQKDPPLIRGSCKGRTKPCRHGSIGKGLAKTLLLLHWISPAKRQASMRKTWPFHFGAGAQTSA
jgi:hypothetical protein